MMVRIKDCDQGTSVNVSRFNNAFPCFVNAKGDGVIGFRFEANAFKIEDDVSNVLHHSRDTGEFVSHTFDFDTGDSAPPERRQKNSSQGIAQG
jgi:hypothetical protein